MVGLPVKRRRALLASNPPWRCSRWSAVTDRGCGRYSSRSGSITGGGSAGSDRAAGLSKEIDLAKVPRL